MKAFLSIFSYFILLNILWVTPLIAQDNPLIRVRKYSVAEGLSHREVRSICQDKRGMMWFATAYGLDRFDGYSFKWYTQEKNGLSSNDIEELHLDKQGNIWLFSQKENRYSIDIVDPVTDSVRNFTEAFGNDAPFLPDEIISFVSSENGQIAILTKEKIILYHSVFSEIPLPGVSLNYGDKIFLGKNEFWVLTEDGEIGSKSVFKIDEKGKIKKEYDIKKSTFVDIYEIKDNGNAKASYFYYDWPNEKVHQYFYELTNEGAVKDTFAQKLFLKNKIRIVYEANFIRKIDSNYWVSSDGQGFWIIPENVNSPPIQLSKSYPDLDVARCVFKDDMGVVWVGTAFGIYSLQIGRNKFTNYFSLQKDVGGFPVRGLQVTGQGPDKKLWAMREDKGDLWKVDLSTKRETLFLDAGDTRWALDKTGEGTLLFVSEQGIRELNPLSESYVKTYPYRFLDIATYTWKIHRDKYGKVWFDKGNNGTLYYDQNGELHEINAWSGSPGLSFLYQFVEDKTDTAWLVSDKGLFRLNIKDGKVVERFWRNGKGHNYLPFDNVHHIWVAPDYIWLATANSGLVQWHPDKGVLKRYTRADGLSNNNLYAVYPDEFGNLWMPSDYGINMLNEATGQVRVFTTDDGICHNEFNRISHCRDDQGYFYFGTLDGVTSFHPKDFIADTTSFNPSLIITDFQQFDGGKGKLINKTAELLKTGVITLKPNDPLFSLNFSLLTYDQMENVQYAYKIEGLDHDWVYQKAHMLKIGRLPYGTHELRIKGQAANGQWLNEELKIKVVTLKPFYLQYWFLTSVVLFAFVGITLFVRIREKSLVLQRARLLRAVRVRTATIEQQKEELKSLDKFKSRFFANVSHELRTPLTMILGPLESLLASNTAEKSNERYFLKLMRDNSRKLLRIVNDILDLSKLESGKLELKEEQVALQQFLRPILAQFASFAESNGIRFEVDNRVSEKTYLLLDADKVETILYNYLSNAIKYTPAGGRIKVSIFEEGENIRFEVCDSGLGIHKNDINHIFDRYYQSENTNRSDAGGTGIGLSLVSQLSELMGGKVGVKSSWGQGSTFFLTLPKKVIVEQPTTIEEEQAWDLAEEQMESAPVPLEKKNSKTVLIVEDNEALRKYLQNIIGKHYNTVTAENGHTALEYLKKSLEAGPDGKLLPDLILSDLMMPVMNGSQLLSSVKNDDRLCHLPFIMLTARVDAGTKLEALRVGVDDYLTKPFKEEELQARIHNLLKNYERRQIVEKQNQGSAKEISGTLIHVSAEDRTWLAKFEEYVQENLTSDMLTVPEMAREFSMSESSLLRQLKRLTGLSPKQYLQEARLDLARQLLESGRYNTVSEVAYKVGYTHTPSFTRSFKERFGVPPSEMLPA